MSRPRGEGVPSRTRAARPDARSAPAIQSVQRAARILGLFTTQQPRLSLGELRARTGMNKATVHRYVTALRAAGLLRLEAGLYTLGPRVVVLAAAALEGLAVVRVAGPYLERLVGETHETAVLSVWDGEAPVTVRVRENTGSLVRIIVTVGSRLPPTSSQGQVFRAFLERERRDPALARVRAQGLAVNSSVVNGITTLAAPVFQGSEIIATIALVGTTASICDAASESIADSLRATAQELSEALGFVSPGL